MYAIWEHPSLIQSLPILSATPEVARAPASSLPINPHRHRRFSPIKGHNGIQARDNDIYLEGGRDKWVDGISVNERHCIIFPL